MMDDKLPDYYYRLNALVSKARSDEEFRTEMQSGEQERVMKAMEQAGFTDADMNQLTEDLSILIQPAALGFWRFLA
jgi:hypothetical protein